MLKQHQHAVALTSVKEAETKQKRLRGEIEAVQEQLRFKRQRRAISELVGQYHHQLGRSVAAQLDKTQLLDELEQHKRTVSNHVHDWYSMSCRQLQAQVSAKEEHKRKLSVVEHARRKGGRLVDMRQDGYIDVRDWTDFSPEKPKRAPDSRMQPQSFLSAPVNQNQDTLLSSPDEERLKQDGRTRPPGTPA